MPKGCTALSRQVVTSARCAISGYPAPHSLPSDTLHALLAVLACMSGAQRAPGPRSRVEEHILLACGNEQRRALNERRHGFNAAWMSAFLADRVIRKQPSAGLRLCGSLQLDFAEMAVLVTGASGYLGQFVVAHYAQEGCKVGRQATAHRRRCCRRPTSLFRVCAGRWHLWHRCEARVRRRCTHVPGASAGLQWAVMGRVPGHLVQTKHSPAAMPPLCCRLIRLATAPAPPIPFGR